MVEDEDILELLEKYRDDLDRATKSLVAAANRGGGEDNITVVAFGIAADGHGDGDQTLRMPPAHKPEEDTLDGVPAPTVDTMVVPAAEVENVLLEPGSAEAEAALRREPISPAARVRLVLVMLVLLTVAGVLLAWGLLR
jgi:hypothetical protein